MCKEAGYVTEGELDIEQIPLAELQRICAEQSWPPEGCSGIADPEGRTFCEKCKELK